MVDMVDKLDLLEIDAELLDLQIKAIGKFKRVIQDYCDTYLWDYYSSHGAVTQRGTHYNPVQVVKANENTETSKALMELNIVMAWFDNSFRSCFYKFDCYQYVDGVWYSRRESNELFFASKGIQSCI